MTRITYLALSLLLSAHVDAQTAPTFHPLSVSPGGAIVDDSGHPVLLRGLNRSATGSGNADATAGDADYAAQNQLLSMNLVRIFVNANWWNNNLNVPIANLAYQDYIDQIIQRAKKYGNYVLVLKAGQFPDPPCGADGKNCPAPNQGDLNCQANASLCVQDTTGNNIDPAFNFWNGFARKYAADPAILYDTWEDMHSIDANTWSNNQNQLIATIRTYNPQALIFVEDIPGAFDAIAAGTLDDFAWSNLVWNFHLYAGPATGCTQTASPRYANWPRNFDPLVAYAQQNGHAVAITEWGGCNDSEPYHTNITSYALAHSIALAYFDSTNLLTQSAGSFKLTATGSKVAQAYTAIAASGPGVVTSYNSADESQNLAPETLATAVGSNLATAPLQASGEPGATNLGGTTLQVTDANGIVRFAELASVSAKLVNYEVPPGVAVGPATLTVSVNGDPVAFGSLNIAPIAPALFSADFTGKGVVNGTVITTHADGSSTFASTYNCPPSGACTAVPINLGAATDQVTLELYGTGIRNYSTGVAVNVGSTTLTPFYAGPQGQNVGLDKVDVLLPPSLAGSGARQLLLIVDSQNTNQLSIAFR